jgi:hypothetical protein
MKTRTIKINARDRQKVEDFADLRCGENQALYKRRGSFKREDILVGGLAEIAAYKLLKDHGFDISKPDFTIHEKGNKSYESDLRTASKHFHVKGQGLSSVKRYGNSWLFQRRDSLTQEPARNHYMIPCEVDLDNNTVRIFGIISFTAIHKYNCWGECAHPAFRHSKLAIYLESLKALSYNARWAILRRYNA